MSRRPLETSPSAQRAPLVVVIDGAWVRIYDGPDTMREQPALSVRADSDSGLRDATEAINSWATRALR